MCSYCHVRPSETDDLCGECYEAYQEFQARRDAEGTPQEPDDALPF
jgi:hypothetical protein